jgi:1-deoxy-D-xylulose-5-phosphate synthase
VNARFLKPLDDELLLAQAAGVRGVVALEEGCAPGGFSAAVLEALADGGMARPVLRCAVPDHIVSHGDPKRLMDEEGLSPESLVSRIRKFRETLS